MRWVDLTLPWGPEIEPIPEILHLAPRGSLLSSSCNLCSVGPSTCGDALSSPFVRRIEPTV
jgi:hypothetical protein